nr:hypothetical protein [Micromonospora sp. DSM 115978]
MGDKHEVTVAASAERDLERLPARVGDEVRAEPGGRRPLLGKQPTDVGVQQATMFEATGSAWRVLYRVDANTRTVRVMVVAHRAGGHRPAPSFSR